MRTSSQNVVRNSMVMSHINSIPMVDQGNLGYCAPATISRIAKYYGVNLNEDEAALIINTDQKEGTNPIETFEYMKLYRHRIHLNVKQLDIGYNIRKDAFDRDLFSRSRG